MNLIVKGDRCTKSETFYLWNQDGGYGSSFDGIEKNVEERVGPRNDAKRLLPVTFPWKIVTDEGEKFVR